MQKPAGSEGARVRVKIGDKWHEAKLEDIAYGPSPEQERLDLLLSLCAPEKPRD